MILNKDLLAVGQIEARQPLKDVAAAKGVNMSSITRLCQVMFRLGQWKISHILVNHVCK